MATRPLYDSVIFVLNEASDGGATKSTLDLLNHLPAGLGRPRLLYSGNVRYLNGGKPSSILDEKAVHSIDNIPLSRPWKLYRYTSLAYLIRAIGKVETLLPPVRLLAKKYDGIFHNLRNAGAEVAYFCKDPFTDFYTVYSAVRAGLKTLCHIRATAPSRLSPIASRFLNRHIGRFVANSHYSKKRWAEVGLAREKIEVVYNACPDISGVRRLQDRPRPKGQAVVIGAAGRMVPWKRQGDLLSAVAKIRNRTGRVPTIALAGEGAMRRELEAQAVELGIAEQVRFSGYRDDILGWMAGLDILVIPSEGEPFGRTALEAMAMGIPVVGADSGGLPEIIRHQHNGLLYPCGDTDALAQTLLKLMDEPARRHTLAENARIDVVQRFSMSQYVKHMTRILEKVAGVVEQSLE